MSVTTDSFYNVEYNTEILDKIGLSKTLNNYTIDEIAEMTYCGAQNKLIKYVSERVESAGMDLVGWVAVNQNTPVTPTNSGDSTILAKGTGTYSNPNGYPISIVWLQCSQGNPATIISAQRDSSVLTQYKIITEFDAPKYEYYLSSALIPINGKGATAWTDDNADLYYYNSFGNMKYRVDANNTIDIQLYIAPYMVMNINGEYVLAMLNMTNQGFYSRGRGFGQYAATGGGVFFAYNSYSVYGSTLNIDKWSATVNAWDGQLVDSVSWQDAWSMGGTGTYYGFADDGSPMTATMTNSGNYPDGTGASRGIWFSNYFGSRDDAYLFLASCGVKFYTDKLYKPLISSGWVYGYTDDMTKESDLDNWRGSTKHNIPVNPPTPPAPDKHDNEVDMNLTHLSTLNGFVKYYIMGISTVDDLADAMNAFDITLIGKDLLTNLISYKMFAIPSGNFSTGTTRTITIAGHEMKKSNNDPIQAPIVTDITPIDLDSITINHVYNDFRDYEPYTKIEMFVPFCGWFTLPPWCMGRTISGKMYIDLPNGTVKAIIKASQTVVAEIGGTCAVDVPFVAQAVGSKTAAVISNMANGLISATNPTPQGLISSSMGIATALNHNYTQCKGVMGDGSNVQGLDKIYIKVTRPAPTEKANGEISAEYKHERGLPCGKYMTLAKGDGFTQITDANITGNMTAREKQMIVDGFRHGLIL